MAEDRKTDRQKDGQAEGQTDGRTMPIYKSINDTEQYKFW